MEGASLVVQTSFLGDTVLTTPLIAHLAERGPVDVVVTPASAPLLANNPSVREIHVYDKRGRDRGLVSSLLLSARLGRRRYAAAYLAQGSVRSGALVFGAGVRQRVGFTTSAGRRFYTRRVDYLEGEHHASRLLRKGESFVALAPGSVWATKKWPHYAALAALLNARVVIVGSTEDVYLASDILRAVGARAIDCAGRLSLLASAELISRAQVLVSNDSAPLHLASAVGTPTVAIFGPTVPEFGFGPLAPRSVVLGVTTLGCRPCDRHGPQRCPLGHWRCMREITPRQVADAVQTLSAPSARLPTSAH